MTGQPCRTCHASLTACARSRELRGRACCHMCTGHRDPGQPPYREQDRS